MAQANLARESVRVTGAIVCVCGHFYNSTDVAHGFKILTSVLIGRFDMKLFICM